MACAKFGCSTAYSRGGVCGQGNKQAHARFCFIVRNLQLKLYVYLYEDMRSRGGEWGYFGLPETPTRAI